MAYDVKAGSVEWNPSPERLRELTEKPLSLYKVVVSCTPDELERWLSRADSLGCHDIFVVGADSTEKAERPGAMSVEAATSRD